MFRFIIFFLIVTFYAENAFSQEISLFRQFNGRYNYTAIGNTLNQFENNIDRSFCELLPSSQANLELDTNSSIVAAFLYWAGSGEGDEQVSLNGEYIEADITYNVNYDTNNNEFGILTYFSCFADITHFIQNNGNTSYTFSDLDISEVLAENLGYCDNRTNFGGWAIYVIYEDNSLPLNQINLFQGLEIINRNVQEKIISLENINVLDNNGAKIGFLTWEGDAILAFGETLSINNNLISNPPLNPANNAFNGTNSFTDSSEFYNCDLDVYNIENNINIGDSSVEIKLTTGDFDVDGDLQADLIIINNMITVLNSQLPDATVSINPLPLECYTRDVILEYTVFNVNSTEVLPAFTPLAFYIDSQLIAQSETQSEIPIGGSETYTITVTIPDSVPDEFVLTIVVDDDGTSNGIVIELNETNNESTTTIQLIPFPEAINLAPLNNCDVGFNSAEFDLTIQESLIDFQSQEDINYYETLEDLQNEIGEILVPEYYQNATQPQTIYIRVNNDTCFEIYQFNLIVENCPPYIPEVFTPNNDGYNDWFNIQGLYTIFEKHKLLIYNRWGTLIFEGNDDKKWDGRANRGLTNQGVLLPVGTYYYVLYLNDGDYKPMTGYVYMTY